MSKISAALQLVRAEKYFQAAECSKSALGEDAEFADLLATILLTCSAFEVFANLFEDALTEYGSKNGFLARLASRAGRAQASTMRKNMLEYRDKFMAFSVSELDAPDAAFIALYERWSSYVEATLLFFDGALERHPG